MSTVAIALEDVSLYRRSATRRRHVLDQTSLAIYTGETLGLMGASGVGKSTIVELVAGYIRPDRGRVRERGIDVIGPDRSRLVVFQENALWPWLSVEKNVRLGLLAGGDGSRIDRLLDMLSIGEARRALPAELSGGMAKRVELARALAARPAVLLLDEAFRSLDLVSKRACIAAVKADQHQFDTAVLQVTHDVEEALSSCDRIVVLAGQPARITAEIAPGSTDAERAIARTMLLSRLEVAQ